MSGTYNARFSKPLAGVRLADTRRGDSLQDVALRELGDAARWVDLADLNDLAAPWITDDPALAGPRVLLAGHPIRIPASAPQVSGVVADETDILGTDVALRNGQLEADIAGDLVLVSGTTNLRQAILHRIDTAVGELVFHPAYGCGVKQLLGARADAVTNGLAALFVDRALRLDPRISRMEGTTATIDGDVLRVESIIITVDAKRVPLRT